MAVVEQERGAAEPEESSEEEEADSDDDGETVSYLEDPPTDEERRLLTRRMFPSKVGGRPAWLIPRGLPSKDLACRQCSRPLRFLLQVYASREGDKVTAFHRVLHLFICTNCQPNQVRAFRAQLPRVNPFYSSEPPDAKEIARALREAGDRDPELAALCCEACGMPTGAIGGAAGSRCPECLRLGRILETPAVLQERELSTAAAELPEEEDAEDEEVQGEDVEEFFTPGAAKATGRDRDLVADAEAAIASAEAKGASADVLEKLCSYREKVAEMAGNMQDVSEQNAFEKLAKENGDHDPVFTCFNKYAAANDGHVLRYAFGGAPLWFSKQNQLKSGPPRCEYCGSERIFEFQVQPQLIALLGSTRLAERLDFGVVCCYVCSESCDAASASSPYLEEFVHVQPEPYDAWLPKG